MNPAGAGNKRNTPPRPAAAPGSHTGSQSPEVPATGTDRRPPCQHLTGLRSACTKLLRAGIAAIVRPRDGHKETINEINKTRRNAAIAVKACRGRQARVASDALPVSRGRAGPRRPAPAPGEPGPGGPPSPGPGPSRVLAALAAVRGFQIPQRARGGPLPPPLVPRLVPHRPAARCLAVHHQVADGSAAPVRQGRAGETRQNPVNARRRRGERA